MNGKGIIRIWRGKVLPSKADEYEELMKRIAAPDYGAVDGLKSLYFTRREMTEYVEFLLITHWESIDAIRAFSGDDVLKAKYYREDRDFLLSFPEYVEHYEVFDCR